MTAAAPRESSLGAASVPALERSAVVVRTFPGRVAVRCDATSGCALCAAGNGCRGGLLRALAGRHGLLEVEVEAGRFRIGDEVRIRMPVEAVERAALWCYGAPVAGTLLGALFAAACVPAAGDAATVTGAALGLGLTYIALRRRTRRMGVAGAVRLELGDDAQDGATRG